MKVVFVVARILLGLMFTVFGANGFHPFMPMQMPTGLAGQFMTTIFQSHFAYLIFAAQLLSGILLLINLFVPLAVTILAGVIVNIIAFHATMDPKGMPMALGTAVIWFVVFLSVRRSFAGILSPRSS